MQLENIALIQGPFVISFSLLLPYLILSVKVNYLSVFSGILVFLTSLVDTISPVQKLAYMGQEIDCLTVAGKDYDFLILMGKHEQQEID